PVDFARGALSHLLIGRLVVDARILDTRLRDGPDFAWFPSPPVRLFVRQHRVVVELLANLLDELQPGELQKANGLLQLRGHHELLREPELLLDLHVNRRVGVLGPLRRGSLTPGRKKRAPKTNWVAGRVRAGFRSGALHRGATAPELPERQLALRGPAPSTRRIVPHQRPGCHSPKRRFCRAVAKWRKNPVEP